jgi:hypothetical protein
MIEWLQNLQGKSSHRKNMKRWIEKVLEKKWQDTKKHSKMKNWRITTSLTSRSIIKIKLVLKMKK